MYVSTPKDPGFISLQTDCFDYTWFRRFYNVNTELDSVWVWDTALYSVQQQQQRVGLWQITLLIAAHVGVILDDLTLQDLEPYDKEKQFYLHL